MIKLYDPTLDTCEACGAEDAIDEDGLCSACAADEADDLYCDLGGEG